MKRAYPAHTLFICVVCSLGPVPAVMGQPQPAVEYSTLLKDTTIYHTNANDMSRGGTLHLNEVIGVFMPEEFYYTGQNDYAFPLKAVLRKAGSAEPVFTKNFWINKYRQVFSRLQPQPQAPDQYEFTAEGQYVLTFELEGKPITQLPLSISFKQSGDAFNPQKYTLVDGPWNEYALIGIPKNSPDEIPFFRLWVRGGLFNETGQDEDLELVILNEGDTVFTSGKSIIGNNDLSSRWTERELKIEFTTGDGGGPIRARNLLKKDGDYQVVLKRTGKIWAVYPFAISAGKIQPHPEQVIGYQPAVHYKAGRVADENEFNELFWVKRLSPEAAKEILEAGPAVAAAPTAADRAGWSVQPKVDADRPFELVLTDVKTRMDSMLVAGDGIVAFGTGSSKGVSYIRVGENQEQSIPDGQRYSSGVFAVCGRKIVLAADYKVFVFDTDSGQTIEIPESDIRLMNVYGGLYKPDLLHGSGYLVATVNDPKKVTDRAMVKVIDVSGPQPRIIPIKNADFPAREITSIAVDAALGKVVMANQRKKALFVADVAPSAVPRGLDLSGHDGIGKFPLVMGGGYVGYVDGSGKSKFRMVDLQGGKILTAGPYGGSGYAVNGGRYAYLSDAPSSGTDMYFVGTAPSMASGLGNSGQDIPQSNGNYGVGTSTAIAPDGTVFVAGQAGVASAEFLLASDGANWVAIKGPDGKPLPATDVVMGDFVMAFRTGRQNDTAIGYATFGRRIDLSAVSVSGE